MQQIEAPNLIPKANRFPWLLSIVELPRALRPGDKIGDREGRLVTVYEVRRMALKSTLIAGKRRPLFAVLHGGANSLTVCVLLHGRQREWALVDHDPRHARSA